MRQLRPAFPRSLTRSFEGLFWTALLGAFCSGFAWFAFLLGRLSDPRHAPSPAFEHFILLLVGGAFALLCLVLTVQGFLGPRAARYEVGATDLTVRTGTLWHHTTTIPLVGITRIDAVRGPLMRLFGLTDLRIYTMSTAPTQHGAREWPAATLLGMKEGEDLRRYLLDRRDTLHESVLRGDLSVARTPQELQMERLSIAVERLERRLPKT